MEDLKVLELFSGIGGMHFALLMSKFNNRHQILAAVDINENANATYFHNFPEDRCLNKNIQKLGLKEFQQANCLLMSPPCQPFTRNGTFKDTEDRRSDAFHSICTLIKDGSFPLLSYIMMENVMGFEKSQMRKIFTDALQTAGFHFQEFNISPTQVGVANTRHRYYCIARKSGCFSFASSEILTELPNYSSPETPKIMTYIENDSTENHLVPDTILTKRFQVLDICTKNSYNSMCFTKSYSRYIEGTGSVYCPMNQDELEEKIAEIEKSHENLSLKKALKLRFFTANEVAKLMSFPSHFSFPESISEKQRYKLIGNSINVLVVSELINLLKEF